MPRMILSMPPEEKKWLEDFSGRHHLSAAEVIRRALKLYRRQSALPGRHDDVLNSTHGAWTSVAGGSQAYVDRMRGEWERRK